MKMIVWTALGAPGGARLVDGAELARMQMVLNGEPFFDPEGLRSLIDKGLTMIPRDGAALGFAAVNSLMVKMAVEVGQGDLDAARNTDLDLNVVLDKLMAQVPYDGSPTAHALGAMLDACAFDATVIDRGFDPESLRLFLAEVVEDLTELQKDKARLQEDLNSSNERTYQERRRLARQVEVLGEVERDLRLVKSAVENFKPSAHQRQVRSAVVPSQTIERTTKGGCYIATAIYGSYDMPPVLVLRDWRDRQLASTAAGRAFIRAYYAMSPTLVRGIGRKAWVLIPTRTLLDLFVSTLERRGYGATRLGASHTEECN